MKFKEWIKQLFTDEEDVPGTGFLILGVLFSLVIFLLCYVTMKFYELGARV